MDKDNKDDFTFAKLSDLTLPFTFRMYAIETIYSFSLESEITDYRRSQLEGTRHPRSVTELLDKPELRFHGVQSS